MPNIVVGLLALAFGYGDYQYGGCKLPSYCVV